MHRELVRVAAMRGDLEMWRRFSARALDAAAQLDDGGSWVRHLHCQIGLDAVGLGDVPAAREHFRAATPPKREPQSVQTTMRAAASAFEHTLRGDFATAGALLREVNNVTVQSYPILVHVKSANFALEICSGDEARLRRDDTESFLRYGIERGMKVAIGLLGGPYSWTLGIRGEHDAAAGWIERIARALPGPHRFLFAYLAAAQFGRRADALTMREQLVARPRARRTELTKRPWTSLTPSPHSAASSLRKPSLPRFEPPRVRCNRVAVAGSARLRVRRRAAASAGDLSIVGIATRFAARRNPRRPAPRLRWYRRYRRASSRLRDWWQTAIRTKISHISCTSALVPPKNTSLRR